MSTRRPAPLAQVSDFDIRLLRIFRSVVECGGFSAADGDATAELRSVDTIDLPLGWSPDGETLAVRSVEGETPYEAGASRVELVRNGVRQRISDTSDVTIVGWLP